MLNLKNNENDAVFDEICKKKKSKFKIEFQKMMSRYFFGLHPLVEKSATATDTFILFIYNSPNKTAATPLPTLECFFPKSDSKSPLES